MAKKKTRVVLPGGIQGLVRDLQNGTSSTAGSGTKIIIEEEDDKDAEQTAGQAEGQRVDATATKPQTVKQPEQSGAEVSDKSDKAAGKGQSDDSLKPGAAAKSSESGAADLSDYADRIARSDRANQSQAGGSSDRESTPASDNKQRYAVSAGDDREAESAPRIVGVAEDDPMMRRGERFADRAERRERQDGFTENRAYGAAAQSDYSVRRNDYSEHRSADSDRRNDYSGTRDEYADARNAYAPNRDEYADGRNAYDRSREVYSDQRGEYSGSRPKESGRPRELSIGRGESERKGAGSSPADVDFDERREEFVERVADSLRAGAADRPEPDRRGRRPKENTMKEYHIVRDDSQDSWDFFLDMALQYKTGGGKLATIYIDESLKSVLDRLKYAGTEKLSTSAILSSIVARFIFDHEEEIKKILYNRPLL